MPRKRLLDPEEVVRASLGVQLLDFTDAEALANQTWAGVEEILESPELPLHPSKTAVLRLLLDRGWESDSITGLLLGIWLKKTARAAEIAGDLLALEQAHRRVLTALYAVGDDRTVVQFSVTRDGGLVQHTYSRKALAVAEIPIFTA